MTKIVLSRLVVAVPLLFLISVLVFGISQATPGDPVEDAFGERLDDEAIETIRRAHGLDQPAVAQYFYWLRAFVTEGGGISIAKQRPAMDVLLPAFANTAVLALASLIVFTVVGVAAGFVTGLRRGTLTDRFWQSVVQAGSYLSIYWFGIVLIWLFAVELGVLPAGGMRDPRQDESFADLLRHLVLPAIAGALGGIVVLARLTRSSVIAVLEADFFTTFRAIGLPRRLLYGRHLARNVASPVVNTVGLQLGTVLSGVVFVEIVFSWPGVGRVLTEAVGTHDYPVVQTGVMLVAAVFIVVNLATDLTLDVLNPRLRQGRRHVRAA